MNREISIIIIFILCLFSCFFAGCYVGRKSIDTAIQETTITVSTDTVYVQGGIEIDTVIIAEGISEQRIKFNHFDNKIDISGIIFLPSKRLELSYFIKPIEIQIIGDSVINSSDYNITLAHSPVYPSGLPRERFVIYSGVAYHRDNKKIDPCIMAGVKFNRITFYAGLSGTEIITAGLSYGF